ncbi:hypothetical protein ELI_1008 [Eubacterium callanderi]|uniref:Uncharacterized protein n=1 Tax=Eubacterium callanderi TaxID=53442 RepID=E3GKJ1_9FIRM|nr:hypothetical protein ELI_1008 [Eubacterium callanderi]
MLIKLNQEHKKKNIINAINHQIEFCLAVNFQFVEQIANPVEPVNGQDERHINVPPLTVPPVFADG